MDADTLYSLWQSAQRAATLATDERTHASHQRRADNIAARYQRAALAEVTETVRRVF